MELEKKRILKEKEYLLKQIDFLERINFDEKTRSLQSYRESYLEAELERLRKSLKESKSELEKKLEEDIIKMKEEKYTLESHYKAVKIANECLIKQLNEYADENQVIVLSSPVYIQLR